MGDVKLRRLGGVVDEWKKLTKGDAPPILAVTIVYNDYLQKSGCRSQIHCRDAQCSAIWFEEQATGRRDPAESREYERHRLPGLCQSMGRRLHRDVRVAGHRVAKTDVRYRQGGERRYQGPA